MAIKVCNEGDCTKVQKIDAEGCVYEECSVEPGQAVILTPSVEAGPVFSTAEQAEGTPPAEEPAPETGAEPPAEPAPPAEEPPAQG